MPVCQSHIEGATCEHSGLPEPYACECARKALASLAAQHPFMCHQLFYIVKQRSSKATSQMYNHPLASSSI